ncbi:MAG: ATP-binding protein [Thiolinea sp.]
MTIISGAIELIAASDALPDEVRSRLRAADLSVANASNLTRQLLRYSGKNTSSATVFNMEEFGIELKDVLTVLVGKKNNLLMLFLSKAELNINKEMLLSSIINLVKNANEALSGNGNISVIIRDVPIAQKVDEKLDDDRAYLSIEVIDNGPGVPVSRREKLFEPFITTKAEQGGAGLGLWTLYNFITQVGGKVTYQDVQAGGSHFRLLVPTHQDKEIAASELAHLWPDECLRERVILLVESDTGFCDILSHFLISRGAKVTAVSTVHEAKTWLAVSASYDIVMTAAELPDGTGDELVREAKASKAGVITVLINTLSNSKHLEVSAADLCLQRPLSLLQLGSLLAQQIQRQSF